MATPSSNQHARRLSHHHRHLTARSAGVGAWNRIVEKHHDPVARELVERAHELGDERPQRAVVFAKEGEVFLGFGGLGKGGVAAQISDHDDNLAAVAFEDLLVALRDD